LDALQARIQPHFLFNSLNAAAELTQTDASAAEAALLDLAGLFRAAMHAGAEVSLGEELEISRQYLALERLRLEHRLEVAWDLPAEVPQIRVPCLTLQPLLENAVRHGIERCANGGIISIQLVASARFATIVLVNPVGENRQKHSGNGIALANIRRRLELMYGNGASLTTSSQDGQYRVKLVLPVQVFKAS
jgi:two-component system sensor histidine kinase AlgZ